jgi:hypothetical protein
MKALEERFWEKVEPEPNTGCWLWTSSVAGNGYGTFYCYGRNSGAHRVAWELTNGTIPRGLYVCHRCDTTLCVNPGHLFLGTNAENQRDSCRKGRAKNQVYANGVQVCVNAGHPLTPDNSYFRADGHKQCRACAKVKDARTYERKKAARAS